MQLVSKPLSAVIGCKARGFAFSAKRVLNVLQHAFRRRPRAMAGQAGPFPPAALASAFSLDLGTNLVLSECLKPNARALANGKPMPPALCLFVSGC